MTSDAIAQVAAYAVSYPMPPGSRLTMGTGHIVRRDAVVVKVLTEGGLVGWGESFHARSHTAIAALVNGHLSPLVVGMDAMAVVDVWSRVYDYQLAGYGAGAACYIALSGIDMALWDIRGKAAGMPLYRLLGGSRRRVRAYAGGLSLGFEEPARLVDRVGMLAQQGYRAIKLRVGDSVERDIERLTALRKAFPAMEILADANMAYTLEGAQRALPVFDELRIGWLEEPFSMDDRGAYRLAARKATTPLAAGENLYGRFEFARAMEEGSLRILQPDLSKAGGITEVLRIAALASAHKLPVHIHSSMTGINQAASIHFLAGMESPGYFEADVSEANRFRDELVVTPWRLESDGTVLPSDKPGLGIEVDETFLQKWPGQPGLTNRSL